MRILAIGGNGFIGPPVVRRLRAAGHEVAVLHRSETSSDPQLAGAVHIRADRDDLAAACGDIAAFAPDVVFDVICYTEQQASELMQCMQSIAQRLVVVSSCDVYRNFDGVRGRSDHDPDQRPLTEDSPLREKLYPYRDSEYAFRYRDEYDKILVERIVMSEPALPCTVLRLPAVYGPGDRKHRLRPYVQRMDDDRTAILMEDAQAPWRWPRGYVENVAHATVQVLTSEHDAHRTYNVADAPSLTEIEWALHVAEAMQWRGEFRLLPREAMPAHLQQEMNWRYHMDIDTTRIRAELGFSERCDLAESLRGAIAWERSEPADEPPDYAAEDAAISEAAPRSTSSSPSS